MPTCSHSREAAYAMVLNDTARADFDKVLALDPANAAR